MANSFTVWQGVGAALQLAFRALAAANLREPGPPGQPGKDGQDGAPGRDGADGGEWRAAGFYEASRAYSRGDVVALDGGSFVAVNDEPGVCPGEGWSQIVRRGKPGPKGDRGEGGLPGQPAPRLLTLRALPGYMAQPIFDDGSEGQPFTVRAWFEYHEGLS